MKRVLIHLIITCTITISANSLQIFKIDSSFQQDTLINFLTNLNLAQFKDKPIDTFITHIPQNFHSLKILGGSRDDMAGKLLISYNNNIFIFVRVIEFSHIDPTNPDKIPPNQRWEIALMRKEKIYSIRVYNGKTLINSYNED